MRKSQDWRFEHDCRQNRTASGHCRRLNWGGIGLFGFDTVAFLFGGQMSVFSRVIYALVGLAGLWCITLLLRNNEETGHAPHTAS